MKYTGFVTRESGFTTSGATRASAEPRGASSGPRACSIRQPLPPNALGCRHASHAVRVGTQLNTLLLIAARCDPSTGTITRDCSPSHGP
jgi:hypothetical protein